MSDVAITVLQEAGVAIDVLENKLVFTLEVNGARLALCAAAYGETCPEFILRIVGYSEENHEGFTELLERLREHSLVPDDQLARECFTDALFPYGTFCEASLFDSEPSFQKCLDDWWSGDESAASREQLLAAAAAARSLDFADARRLCGEAAAIGNWPDLFADDKEEP